MHQDGYRRVDDAIGADAGISAQFVVELLQLRIAAKGGVAAHPREGHHATDRKPSRVTIACPPAGPTTAITVITAVPSPNSSAG